MRTTLPSGTAAEVVHTVDAPRGLVVVPDIMGLRPLFDEMVQRLAAETGWSVVAVEPFPGLEGRPLDWRLDHVGDLDDDRIASDLASAADLLQTPAVAVIGFCMGGMYTLKAAGSGRFDRAGAFYGMIRIPERWRSPTQREPLEALRSSQRCPTIAIVGSEVPGRPRDVADLEAAGVEVVRYEGADHGFVHDPDRPAHRRADAADAWRRVLAFVGGGELSERAG